MKDTVSRAAPPDTRAVHFGFGSSPLPGSEVFGSYGWSRLPAPLKLPGLAEPGAPAPATRARPTRLRSALRLHRRSRPSAREHPAGQGDHGEDDHRPSASPLTVLFGSTTA